MSGLKSIFTGPKLPDPPKPPPVPTPEEAVAGVTPDARKRLAAALSQRSTLLSGATGAGGGLAPMKQYLGQ